MLGVSSLLRGYKSLSLIVLLEKTVAVLLVMVWGASKTNKNDLDQPNHEMDVLAGHENCNHLDPKITEFACKMLPSLRRRSERLKDKTKARIMTSLSRRCEKRNFDELEGAPSSKNTWFTNGERQYLELNDGESNGSQDVTSRLNDVADSSMWVSRAPGGTDELNDGFEDIKYDLTLDCQKDCVVGAEISLRYDCVGISNPHISDSLSSGSVFLCHGSIRRNQTGLLLTQELSSCSQDQSSGAKSHDVGPFEILKPQQLKEKVSWLTLSIHEEDCRYILQKEDEVANLRQGHQEYLNFSSLRGSNSLDFNKDSGDSCCKMILKVIDPNSEVYSKTFKLTLPDLVTFPDFLVKRSRYEGAIQRKWTCRDKCKVWWRNKGEEDGRWWEGGILAVKPKSTHFLDSPWESMLLALTNLRTSEKRIQDSYGLQKLNQIMGNSSYTNRFPVPLSLEVIRSRIENNYYRSMEALRHDVSVMLSNAETFFDLNKCVAPTRNLCHPEQRDAILEFKNEFEIQKPCVLMGLLRRSRGRITAIVVLGMLVSLAVEENEFTGNFLLILLNLTNLSDLSLSRNQFTGTLPPNMSSLSNLVLFYADANAFTGTIPSSLLNIPSLSCFDLSDNQLNGNIEFGNISSSLSDLLLGNNNFRGSIHKSISKLVNLYTLDLSHFNTQGSINFSIFSDLKLLVDLHLSHLNTTTTIDLNTFLSSFKSLDTLDLSGNHVSAINKSSVSNPLLLSRFNLSGCGVTEFPEFLRTQQTMEILDISNNKINGQVPGWLWTLPTLDYVNLSNNTFTGFQRLMVPSSWQPSMNYFSGANNNFTGNLPAFICALRSLAMLDLSDNKFNGSIPRCMGNFSSTLQALHLRKNHLSGVFPEKISESLKSLDVGHNQLVGKLPRSLVRISSLEVLNVENNKINDTFPFWLSSLQELQVLVLRSNAFHGPMQQTRFPNLRIIDVSHNHFNGTLPSDFFVNWTVMFLLGENEDQFNGEYMGTSYYSDSIVVMNKGLEMEMVRILKIFTSIDFSRNKFEGEIPKSIGLLKELHVLNLSSNTFTGHIPSSMGKLRELESLDVSQNKLSGDIPQDLGDLSYLAYMNFSHNQLVGPLPGGTQFLTQNCSSFEENAGHFGPSLEKFCDIHGKTMQESEMPGSEEDEEEVISWIAATIGFIPGIAFGLMMGYILVCYKPEWFMNVFGKNKSKSTSSTTR
ncbi:unnamed protein product [Arabidopsis thaliana]|uniref:Receptor like protein n=1 Tax=Arabidopsis thaliana TaxID=3702 RepID=A0A7G2E954_ARATH|nr:unnamed protein product [Arabidopsis thaliana]